MKVAIIYDFFGPYHWARILASTRVLDLIAIEVFAANKAYPWQPMYGNTALFHRKVLPAQERHCFSRSQLASAVYNVLEDSNADVVAIPGWSDQWSIAALAWCARFQVPAILMSESTAWDGNRSGWLELIKRRVIRLCASGLVGGTPHREYLEALGMQRGRIYLGYDAVDNQYFAQETQRARSAGDGTQRRNVLPDHYFLASARFIEKKNLANLIQAFGHYRGTAAQSPNGNKRAGIWDLVLLGDGPLRPELVDQIAGLGLRDCVHLPGFKQYPDLPAYYALAGAFVHASTTEQWGLVVNEAMASGLPVLVSNRCGCARDLVEESRNGFTFDPLNVSELAGRMAQIAAPSCDREAMGKWSREIIARWGPDAFAQGLSKAAETALAVPVPKPSLLDRLLLQILLRR